MLKKKEAIMWKKTTYTLRHVASNNLRYLKCTYNTLTHIEYEVLYMSSWKRRLGVDVENYYSDLTTSCTIRTLHAVLVQVYLSLVATDLFA